MMRSEARARLEDRRTTKKEIRLIAWKLLNELEKTEDLLWKLHRKYGPCLPTDDGNSTLYPDRPRVKKT